MLRFNVELMVILSLCIVNSSIGHPGHGYGVSPEALVSWEPPTSGHGDGTVKADTKIRFWFGTHNADDFHSAPGHGVESLQQQAIFNKGNGAVVVARYLMFSATRGKVPGSDVIEFDPDPLERSAEKCFDVFAHSYGVMTDGSGYYYNYTSRWSQHRDDLPDHKCNNTANAIRPTFPWSNDDVYNELRQFIQIAQLGDSTVVGASNTNGDVSLIRQVGANIEIAPEVSFVSSVLEVAEAPSIRRLRPRTKTLTWASLKKQ